MRLTAERLLSEHVRCPGGVSGEDARHPAIPGRVLLAEISLYLTGAFLIGLDLSLASVVDARFAMATFNTDDARFDGTTFIGGARFSKATFIGDARFREAAFTGYAIFAGSDLHRRRQIRGGGLQGDAWFDEATFKGDALFNKATFTGKARFSEATFTVSALARHLGVDWHTLWDAVRSRPPPASSTPPAWPG